MPLPPWLARFFPHRPPPRRRRALRLECLEGRVTPSILMVTNLNDDGSAGSLRAVIAQANADGGGDMVVFAPGLSGSITLTGGELLIDQSVAINGPGAGRVTVSGNHASRLFEIDAGNVTISGLTLTGGNSTGGGAVENFASLTLSQDVLTGNTDNGSDQTGGGAVVSIGGGTTLTIDRCTLSNNTTGWTGGAISLIDGGSLTLTGSTVAGNTSARDGGGITVQSIHADATATVINSTIANNTADQFGGGGVLNIGFGSGTTATLLLEYCTIAGNDAPAGGGVSTTTNSGSAATSYLDTLFAANIGGNAQSFQSATETSLGHNLSDDTTGGLTAPGDLPNANPDLGVLQNNGGPTPTLALLSGSPAIAAGVAVTGIGTDQRGFRRPATPDIGAYQTEPSLNVAVPFVTAIATVPLAGLVATFTSGEPNPVPADFAVVIDWGDGTRLDLVSGTIAAVPGPPGSFTVGGSHRYAAAGSDALAVTITDRRTNVSATATSLATVVPFNQSADLEVQQTGPSRATAGGSVTYTITVTNAGPADAQDVTVSDAVPSGTTFLSAEQLTGPKFDLSAPGVGGTGTVVFDPVGLTAGQTATFRVVFQAGVTGPLTNSVTVTTMTPNRNPRPAASAPVPVPVLVTLSSATLADFSAPGTAVGAISLSFPVQLLGQFLPPIYGLPAAEANNAAFALATTAVGEALVAEFRACSGAQATYQVRVHVDVGFGDQVATIPVTVAAAVSPCTSPTAAPVLESVRVVRGGRQGAAQQLVLTFGTALDPGSAAGLGHYRLTLVPAGKGAKRKPITVTLLGASYDPARRAVTLRLGKVKGPKPRGTLTVEGLLGLDGVPGNPAPVTVDLRPKPSHKR